MLEKKNHIKCHLRGMSPARKLTYTPVYALSKISYYFSGITPRILCFSHKLRLYPLGTLWIPSWKDPDGIPLKNLDEFPHGYLVGFHVDFDGLSMDFNGFFPWVSNLLNFYFRNPGGFLDWLPRWFRVRNPHRYFGNIF